MSYAADACTIREATEADAGRIDHFYDCLSDESRYLRFFTSAHDAYRLRGPLPSDALRLVLVAEHDGEVVAAGELDRGHRDSVDAEVAFAVLDAWQHHGLTTRMLGLLAGTARNMGLRTLTAEVLGTNSLMLQVFRESGLPMTQHLDHGVYDVTLRVDAP